MIKEIKHFIYGFAIISKTLASALTVWLFLNVGIILLSSQVELTSILNINYSIILLIGLLIFHGVINYSEFHKSVKQIPIKQQKQGLDPILSSIEAAKL